MENEFIFKIYIKKRLKLLVKDEILIGYPSIAASDNLEELSINAT
jgi:hypothetical protein